MSNPLQQTIETLAKEKGIEPDVVITAIEDAVLTASRKFYKSTENLRTKFNHDTGQVELYSVRQIVEEVADPLTEISLTEAQELYGDEAEVDMEIEFPKPTDVLGRIAAQTAKQVIFQKVREAERDNVYDEFIERVGEVINGIVKRFENGDVIVEMGRVEAMLRRRDQSRAENYTTGDRIRAVIVDVTKETKGQQIILSRTDPALLVKMFEQEVPEIYDGTVSIRGAVREAGDRAKVAVHSHERDIDPVGSCVGMKGTRVQAIIRELRGEKIDIVEWSEDPIVFITNAVSPAKIQRATIVDATERVVELVVEDSQLSLAIGKKGQNVRLAAKLTGWRIDIKSEDEKRREVEAQFEGLEDEDESATLTLPDLDDTQLVKLSNAGLDTADRLLETSVSNLALVAEVDEETAIKLQDAVREQVAAAEQAAAEIEERTIEENDSINSGSESNSQAQEITASEGDSTEKDTASVASNEDNPGSVETGNDLTQPQASEPDTDSKS
ncbi:MAG: transcription termination factor NusA [Acidobacteriota bacterium]|nr:transcription termination factor NusA [Acidobacteriota bacterium]